MMWTICILILTKPGLINNYLLSLISNIIVSFSSILKAILFLILYRIKNKNNLYICSYLVSLVFLIFHYIKNELLVPGCGIHTFACNNNHLQTIIAQVSILNTDDLHTVIWFQVTYYYHK